MPLFRLELGPGRAAYTRADTEQEARAKVREATGEFAVAVYVADVLPNLEGYTIREGD